MAFLVITLLILAMAGHSNGSWCVCKEGLSESVLQKTLDYACGAGADCNSLHQKAPCFEPNTVKSHCSYAVNSFFQKKGQAQGTCDFSGSATISASDPSYTGCPYPSSVSAAGSSTTNPITMTPKTNMPTTSTSGSSTYSGTSSTGVLGPSGTNTDYSDGGFRLLQKSSMCSLYITLFSLCYILL